jgi:selenoprotein W-related protein
VAETISSKIGKEVEVDLIPSSGGVFEVSLDGKLLYSKQKTGRFPDQQEVEGLLASIEQSSK